MAIRMVLDSTETLAAGRTLIRTGQTISQRFSSTFGEPADAVRRMVVTEIQAVTPGTGPLRESTVAGVTIRSTGKQVSADIDVMQTMRVGPNRDGRTFNLADILIHGRDPVVITPSTKRALSWPDARHPVTVVHQGRRDPNPYPSLALRVIDGGSRDILRRWASTLLAGAIRG